MLVNPAPDGIARVRVTAVAPSQDIPVAGLEDIEIPESGRAVIDLGQYINRDELVLVIESTLPIVVERGLYPGFAGFSQSILLPAVETASVPSVDTGADIGE